MRPLLALLVASVLAASFPVEAQAPASALGVVVKAVGADYVPDTWKEEQPVLGDLAKNTLLPPLPVGYSGTYRNPYFDGRARQLPAGPVNAWGYMVNITVEVVDGTGSPLKDPAPNIHVEAAMKNLGGEIPAKLQKLAPTTFRATFDVDGEADKAWPALFGGAVPVTIDIYDQPAGAQRRKLASDEVTVTYGYAIGSVPAVAFPREAFQVYSDLGNITPLASRNFGAADEVPLSFAFGVPNATARAVMVQNRMRVTAFEGKTDAGGVLSFTAKLSDALGSAAGGLVVVEAHLVGDPRTLAFGNGLVVLPVSAHPTSVTSILREARAGEADPLATMRVTVHDPEATPQESARHGRLVLMDGLKVLDNVPFLPVEPGAPDVTHKHARFLARTVAEAGVASYTIYSFLFTERNEFYSLATATRGYSIGAAPAEVEEGKSGALRLTVRNLNDNGDGEQDYGLASTVRIAVHALPGGANWTGDVSLPEAGVQTIDVPFTGSGAGAYGVVINSTSDELRLDRTARVEVTAAKGVLDGILSRLLPAPGAVAALALLGVAALALRRR